MDGAVNTHGGGNYQAETAIAAHNGTAIAARAAATDLENRRVAPKSTLGAGAPVPVPNHKDISLPWGHSGEDGVHHRPVLVPPPPQVTQPTARAIVLTQGAQLVIKCAHVGEEGPQAPGPRPGPRPSKRLQGLLHGQRRGDEVHIGPALGVEGPRGKGRGVAGPADTHTHIPRQVHIAHTPCHAGS